MSAHSVSSQISRGRKCQISWKILGKILPKKMVIDGQFEIHKRQRLVMLDICLFFIYQDLMDKRQIMLLEVIWKAADSTTNELDSNVLSKLTECSLAALSSGSFQSVLLWKLIKRNVTCVVRIFCNELKSDMCPCVCNYLFEFETLNLSP